jgi:hypothetical protein
MGWSATASVSAHRRIGVAQQARRSFVWEDDAKPGCSSNRDRKGWTLHDILAQNTRDSLRCLGSSDFC